MKTRSLVYAVFVACFALALPTFASAQTDQTETSTETATTTAIIEPIGRTELLIKMTPESAMSIRPFEVKITEILQKDSGAVTGKVMMHGRGRDRCTLWDTPVVGTFNGATLLLKVDVPKDDRFACRMALDLKKDANGKFKGRYSGMPNTGAAEER